MITKKFTKSRKKENVIVLFITSFLLFSIIFIFINLFIIRIIRVQSVMDNNLRNHYYLINIFHNNYEENNDVIAKIQDSDKILIGKILIKGPANINITNKEIIINNGNKISLNKDMGLIINKNQNIKLQIDEFFILSNITIDSYFIGPVPKEKILGKVIYYFPAW